MPFLLSENLNRARIRAVENAVNDWGALSADGIPASEVNEIVAQTVELVPPMRRSIQSYWQSVGSGRIDEYAQADAIEGLMQAATQVFDSIRKLMSTMGAKSRELADLPAFDRAEQEAKALLDTFQNSRPRFDRAAAAAALEDYQAGRYREL
jgi:hypothetical protein